MDLVAHRVGRLCHQATGGQLRTYAQQFGALDVLDRIVDAIGRGRIDARLEADLDALDGAFARHGVDGLTTGSRGYETWRGSGHRSFTAWACPQRWSCPRRVQLDDGDPPVCGLTGRSFTELRIDL